MEKITIERSNDATLGINLFIVRQGDRYTEVYFEEAMAVVCALMMQEPCAMPQSYLRWMKTEEEYDKEREELLKIRDEPLFEEE